MNKEYLGDSVYVEEEDEAGSIILTTENGMPQPSNIIILDPDTYHALVSYVNNLKAVRESYSKL